MNDLLMQNDKNDDDELVEVIDCSDWTPCVVWMHRGDLNLEAAQIVIGGRIIENGK